MLYWNNIWDINESFDDSVAAGGYAVWDKILCGFFD